MTSFCTSCGTVLAADAVFCPRCGLRRPAVLNEGTAQTSGEHPAITGVRDHISQWIMPVNAVVVFATVTVGVLLDFLAPVGPFLALLAGLVGLLWLLGLGFRLLAADRLARAGRFAAWLGDPAVRPWRDRRVLLTGGLVIALGGFALASQRAQAQGGLIASRNPTVQNWQAGLGLLQTQLDGIHAEQKASNMLLQQGNTTTEALRSGQDKQTSVLVDIKETLQGVPKNRMGLKATLWAEDLSEARKLLDAGVTFTLVDTYQLATMGRRRAVDLMVERSQSVEREEKDCDALKDPNLNARIDGKPISNPSQRQVLAAFCGAGVPKNLGELKQRAQAMESQLAQAQARVAPQRAQCVDYHTQRRGQYSKDFATSKQLGWSASKCAFQACGAKDRLEFFSGDPQRFAQTVQEMCAETTTDPAVQRLQAELSSLKESMAAAGK